jgi:hypothetical protein
MGNTSTCFFLFILLKSFSIYIHRGAMVNCEKIISQLGKNIFPVGQILFPSYTALFGQLLHEYTV